MGGSSKKQTVGYKYYLGVHMILCHGPVDSIDVIEVDEKSAWSSGTTGGQIAISSPNLFGGEEREGGVEGVVDIEMGGPTQTRNTYLQSRLGSAIPAFRGVVGAVLRQVYIGMNPYLKRWAFWCTRIHTRQNGLVQWYNTKAAVGTDMNPAHIIRECLTDPDWGMGYQDGDIDDTAFMAAADILYSESMGMSLLWDRSTQLDEFIGLVLKHIDGALFVDRATGKFTIKLARNDYTVGSLLILNEDSIEKISDFKRNTIGELTNSVTVIFYDGSTGKNNSVTVQDIALAAQQGATVGTTIQYPGFTNGTIATKVAARDLRALSIPLASATIYANRTAAKLNIGDVFVLSWPRYGLSQTVMRVSNVELGALDNNLVKLSVIEDVFSLGNAIYAPPPPSGWIDPNTDPVACTYHAAFEAPYWEMAQRLGDNDAQNLAVTSGYVGITGVRPSDGSINAKIYTDPENDATFEEAGTVDFCPTAVLGADVAPGDTIIAITGGIDLDAVRVGSYALLGTEAVIINVITDTAATIGRGSLDTVAAPHTSGTRLFFIDDFVETDSIEYASGEIAHLKLLPTTGRGTLDQSLAPVQNVTVSARQAKPYPPGRLRINGLSYPASVSNSVDLVTTWAHRDRLQQTAVLVDESEAGIGPELGTTYTHRLLTDVGSVIATHSGITGETDTFTLAEMGVNYGDLRVQLWSVRDSIQSYQIHDWQFNRPAP